MFRHRAKWDIIADCLRIIKKHEKGIQLHEVWVQAKVITFNQQIDYSGTLRKSDLILMEYGKVTITNRGIKFLELYKQIEDLLRAGFREKGQT